MTKVLKVYLKSCLFLIPVFFLPIVTDNFGFGKNWLFLSLMLLGLIFWGLTLVIKKEEKMVVSKGWNWLLLLTIWATIGWFLGDVGVRMRALVGMPGLGMLIGMLIWVFLWMQVDQKEGEGEGYLTIAGIMTAISSLVVFLIPISKMPILWPKQNPILSISSDWSLVGSVWGELWLLVILTIIWIRNLLKKIKNGESYIKEIVISAALILVLFLDVFKVFKFGWNFLGVDSSWVIATESLKNKPLQGVGIGNFLEAFNKWRPVAFNNSKNWGSTYTWSANGVLQLWTETGLVGLGLGLLVMMTLVKAQKNKNKKGWLFFGALVLAFTPVNFVALMIMLWLSVQGVEKREIKLNLKVGEAGTNVAPIVLSIIVIIGSIAGMYGWARVLLGEIYLKKSLVAAAANDGMATYNWQIKAIKANPDYAEYRRIYSQTNIALATGLMSDKNISDEQKQQVSVLIQQAVREGKAAVALDPQNMNYWSNLASIYRQLVGSVDGAVDWSYQAYTQALSLDSVNPSLRLDLGGLLYAAGKYNEADRLFEQVVTLKPELANGWYNWAYAAKAQDKLYEAINRLAQAVSLVPVTSGDYDTAIKELENWKKEYETLLRKQNEVIEKTKEAETLKAPEILPSGTKSNVDVSGEGLEPPAMPTVIPSQSNGNQVIEP